MRMASMILLVHLFPCLAFAADGGSSPPDSSVMELPEIVVTGGRIPAAISRTPAAISIIDRGRFIDTRQISLKDALVGVPGLFVQSRGGAQDVRVTIRGFGARGNGDRSNSGSMRGIRILTDGVPISEPDGRTSLEFADIGGTDRIEVSRSNASVLYGNASGGVINLMTDLGFGSSYLRLMGRGGSFGYHRENILGGGVFGKSHATLSLATSSFDGWRAHSMSAQTIGQGRVAAPLDDDTNLGLIFDLTSNFNRYPGALTKAQADSAPEQANPRYVTRDERRINKVGRMAVTLDHGFPDAHDLSVSVFAEPKALQRSERNRFRDFNRYHVGGNAVWSWKPTLESNRVKPVLSAGLDEAFQDGSIQFYNLTPEGNRGLNVIANKREAANSAGVFLQAEATFNEKVLARLAARYDDVHYTSEDRIDPGLNDAKTFHRTTPKGSLAYLLGDHTIYASVGGGVEAPAFNEIDPPAPFDTATSFNPFLETTYSTTVELGGRGNLEEGALKYDVALYRIETRNDLVPFDGGAYFLTAGKTRRQGLEVGLDYLIAPGLKAAGALTVSDNKYVEFENVDGNLKDKKVAGLPDQMANGSIRYAAPQGYSAEFGAEYVGSYFANDLNSENAKIDSYVIFNARAGITRDLGVTTVRAFVGCNNILDKEHIASAFINGLNSEFFEPGLPRNWSFGLTLGF